MFAQRQVHEPGIQKNGRLQTLFVILSIVNTVACLHVDMLTL